MTTSKKDTEIDAIRKALRSVQKAADSAHDAALNLNAAILNVEEAHTLKIHYASDAALIRDSANFLQHLVLTFNRRVTPIMALQNPQRQKNTSGPRKKIRPASSNHG